MSGDGAADDVNGCDDQAADSPHENLVLKTISQARDDLAERLAAIAGAIQTEEETAIWERLLALNCGATGDQQSAIFDQLCAAVLSAYPAASGLSDSSILANPITPELARYALSSLARYGDDQRAGAEGKRSTRIALAFNANNRKGAPGLTGNDARRASEYGQRCYHKLLKAGHDKSTAEEMAVAATYKEMRRDSPEPQSGPDRRRLQGDIRRILQRDAF